jgi:hypothetical protein
VAFVLTYHDTIPQEQKPETLVDWIMACNDGAGRRCDGCKKVIERWKRQEAALIRRDDAVGGLSLDEIEHGVVQRTNSSKPLPETTGIIRITSVLSCNFNVTAINASPS